MTAELTQRVVLCNGADLPSGLTSDPKQVLRLDYRNLPGFTANIKLSLPAFVRDVFYLSPRLLDLLEIAAYVFSADRSTSRGRGDDLEYHSWSRSFHFVVRVRDYCFWAMETTQQALKDVLCFVTGDLDYTFTFLPGHSTPPTGLFDSEQFTLDPQRKPNVALFSGGLDSLAGAVHLLESTLDDVCLVSHQSGSPQIRTAQDRLVEALSSLYHGRVRPYRFHCSLRGTRAVEETQRTRLFLFGSIAYALAHSMGQTTIYLFENGVTSLNLSRRQSLLNARASRTTHPKAVHLLSSLFSEIEGTSVSIVNPFFWDTKTEVVGRLKALGRQDLLRDSVSCSKTFKSLAASTHCGGCYQCVDRKFSVYASSLEQYDNDLYALDFNRDNIVDGTVKTCLVDYTRQACQMANWNPDRFYHENLNELAQIIDFIPGLSENEVVDQLWNLCRRHGGQVRLAIRRMRELHDDPYKPVPVGSFLTMISERDYLREPVARLVRDICVRLREAIPIAFQTVRPRDERDLNDKISAILQTDRLRFEREHPSLRFGLTKIVPDHSLEEYDLLIETKYVRGSTPPSKASEGIAADMTKLPASSHKLFVVYDPDGSISVEESFKADFERKGNCTVLILRSRGGNASEHSRSH